MPTAEPRHPVLRYLRRIRAAAPEASVGDAELLRRFAASRDEAAFELLVWRHGAMVLRVCRGVLRDGHAADDAFQATFLALARRAAAVARCQSPGCWLYRVAFNVALKARAADSRRAARESRQEARPPVPSPAAIAGSAELATLLHEEVNRLATRYRTPVVLCYLEGKTHEEAARALGWPKGTVSGRLARARDVLKRRLTRRGVAFPAVGLAALFGATANAAVTAPLATATARAAAGYLAGGASAAAASAAAVHLSHGVLHAMFLLKLKVFALIGLMSMLAAASTFALAGGGGEQAGPPGAVGGPRVGPAGARQAAEQERARAEVEAARADLARAQAVLAQLESRVPAAPAASRMQSVNNLKQIALAIHNYYAVYDHLPGVRQDDAGRPLLSWRVLILPFIEEHALFERFKQDEPWDSPHNKKLLANMPKVFRAPTQAVDATDTYYQGFSGETAMFETGKVIKFPDVTDGTSNTILVVEGGTAVPWTKPADLPYSAKRPLPKLGGVFPDILHAAFVDGSVHTLRKDFDEETMRAAITRNGGEVYDLAKLHALPARKPAARPGGAVDEAIAFDVELEEAAAALAKVQAAVKEAQDESVKVQKELQEVKENLAEKLLRRGGGEMRRREQERRKFALQEQYRQALNDLKSTRDLIESLRADIERMKRELAK